MKCFAGIATLTVIGILVALLVIITGAYNVSATIPDPNIQRFVFHSTMRRSVQVRAATGFQDTWTRLQGL